MEKSGVCVVRRIMLAVCIFALCVATWTVRRARWLDAGKFFPHIDDGSFVMVDRLPGWMFGGAGGYRSAAIGPLVLWRGPFDGAQSVHWATLSHEVIHVAQWRRLGWRIVPEYFSHKHEVYAKRPLEREAYLGEAAYRRSIGLPYRIRVDGVDFSAPGRSILVVNRTGEAIVVEVVGELESAGSVTVAPVDAVKLRYRFASEEDGTLALSGGVDLKIVRASVSAASETRSWASDVDVTQFGPGSAPIVLTFEGI